MQSYPIENISESSSENHIKSRLLQNSRVVSHYTRGMDMSLVRRINEPGKGCGAILNESAVKNRLYCGVKSSLSFQGQDKYHLCED